MALIDVLKYDGPNDVLVWKWHSPTNRKRMEELRLGTQLVVNQSQIAVFIKGGQIADIFAPGTHTLSSYNLPILTSIIGLPFGHQSPFKAEVYFINKSVVLDCQFELAQFNMLDPNFRVPIPIVACGSFAVRVGEVRQFLSRVIGAMPELTTEHLRRYFRGVITENVKAAIARIARERNINPMELEATVAEVSDAVRETIADTLDRYGLHTELFNIESVSIVDDDPRVKSVIADYHRLMSQDMEERLRLRRRAENLDVYRVERTFDTTEKAAGNIGGSLGGDNILGTIVGLGMAQPLAGTMAGVVSGTLNAASQPTATETVSMMQSKDEILKMLRELGELKAAGILTEEEFSAKKHELLSKI